MATYKIYVLGITESAENTVRIAMEAMGVPSVKRNAIYHKSVHWLLEAMPTIPPATLNTVIKDVVIEAGEAARVNLSMTTESAELAQQAGAMLDALHLPFLFAGGSSRMMANKRGGYNGALIMTVALILYAQHLSPKGDGE